MAGEVSPKQVYVRPKEIIWNDFGKKNFEKFASEWEANALPPAEACNVIEEYLAHAFPGGSATPVGHNIGFDVAFLRQLAFLGGRDQLAVLSHRAIDTHTLLYLLYLENKVPAEALTSDGAFKHFGIKVAEELRHTALGDALATRELFRGILEMLLVDGPQ
jgi:DNA polymerase-3 subunit epsilon